MGLFFVNFAFVDNKFDSSKWGGFIFEDGKNNVFKLVENGFIFVLVGNFIVKLIISSVLDFEKILVEDILSKS